MSGEPHRRTVGPLQPDAAAQDGERVDRQGELNPDPARYLIDHNLAGGIAGFLLTWVNTSRVESSTRWQETPPASARLGTKKLAFKNAVHHGAGRQCTPSLRWQAKRWFINMDRYEAKNILQNVEAAYGAHGQSPAGVNYRFALTFQSEELRQKWVASDVHRRVWPTIENTLSTKNYTVLLFDVS